MQNDVDKAKQGSTYHFTSLDFLAFLIGRNCPFDRPLRVFLLLVLLAVVAFSFRGFGASFFLLATGVWPLVDEITDDDVAAPSRRTRFVAGVDTRFGSWLLLVLL
jgi:hypothetical protein